MTRLYIVLRDAFTSKQGAKISHTKLLASKFGLNFQLVSNFYANCKPNVTTILSKSVNAEIKGLFEITSTIVTTDSIFTNNEEIVNESHKTSIHKQTNI